MKIRLPADLRQRIEDAAGESRRSLNAEIVARLTESFEAPGGSLFRVDLTTDPDTTMKQITDVMRAFAKEMQPDQMVQFSASPAALGDSAGQKKKPKA